MMFSSSSFNYTQLSRSNMMYMHDGVCDFFCLVFFLAHVYQVPTTSYMYVL